MTDLLGWAAIILVLGVVLFGFGVAIAFNTSLGGTRSDYDDMSGCLFQVALAAMGVGLVAGIVWLMGWLQ